MNTWVLLNYDLGLNGSYESLYKFLDNHNALDCGNSNSAFSLNLKSFDDGFDEMFSEFKNILIKEVELKKGDRIYVVITNNSGKCRGKFIYGSRQRAVWEGFGDDKVEDDKLPF